VEEKEIAGTLRSVPATSLWIEDKMKKMKLSLASIIVNSEYYKRKCKNISKLLSFEKFPSFL